MKLKDIPLTIEETQLNLINKSFSVVDLVDSYLERISKYNKRLNAFITVSDDVAYSEAKRADKLITELGKKVTYEYPLIGVVVAYKDLFSTKGIRTTAGSKVLEDYIPAYSATVVERLKGAGCITIGKTNEDAWGHGSSGENSDFGDTKNPWNENYVPGGSSSGSACALAANLSLIATATDTCGSTRLPSNYCYLVGLKPTYGAISRYGVIAMASSLDTVGLIARTVGDVEKVFRVVKGEDGRDSTVKDHEWLDSKPKLRIGVPKEFLGRGLDKEVDASISKTIEIFKNQGIEVKEVSLPTTKYANSVYYIIQPAEVSSNLGRFDGVRFGNTRESFGAEARRRIMLGTYVLSAGYYDAYYLKAMKIRSLIIKEVDQVFKEVDTLIAPVAPTPPFKLGEKVEDPLQMYLTDIYAATANLSGIPSLAIPSGFTKNGLPLGFQLMGPRFSEYTLFSLGKLFEKASGYKPKVANI